MYSHIEEPSRPVPPGVLDLRWYRRGDGPLAPLHLQRSPAEPDNGTDNGTGALAVLLADFCSRSRWMSTGAKHSTPSRKIRGTAGRAQIDLPGCLDHQGLVCSEKNFMKIIAYIDYIGQGPGLRTLAGQNLLSSEDELGRSCAGGLWASLLTHGISLPPILALGSEQQKQKYAKDFGRWASGGVEQCQKPPAPSDTAPCDRIMSVDGRSM